MIYKFRSKSAADVIMMGPNGDEVLRIIGKTPGPKGIIEPADMPAAIKALEEAVAADEALQQAQRDDERDDDDTPRPGGHVSLRQRAWPLVEMMRRAHGASHEVVWGV